MIPLFALAGYHLWTRALYGHGMVAQAASYALSSRGNEIGNFITRAIVLMCFVGGCGAGILQARSQISAISRIGHPFVVTRVSSPWRSRRAMKSDSVGEGAGVGVDIAAIVRTIRTARKFHRL